MSKLPAFGTVLLTGASGFIGRRLRDTLLDANVDVVALRRKGSPPASRGRSLEVDYADVSGLSTIFAKEQPTHVLHVAGATKGVTYQDFARANTMPTENLLTASKSMTQPLERFVFVSSLAAWGPSTAERPHRETDSPAPVEHYGRSKLEAEKSLVTSGIPYTILRPGGVYGPGDADFFQLFKSAAQGWNLYFGNRQRWISLVYVDDLIQLILNATGRPEAVGKGYFVTDGLPVTWENFQKLVTEAAQRKVRDIDIPEAFVDLAGWAGETLSRLDKRPRLANRQKIKMGKQEAWTASIDSAQQDLKFEPKISQSEGVPRTMSWYREAGWV
ncbi:MAG: NAD-dependent epimerase/dehydratase family protein [Myxococcales bacterium]|nr:NAD-dependent epimerase/dehydratase family protein [Myxococcales bacterium]